jgi:hypothetical protein
MDFVIAAASIFGVLAIAYAAFGMDDIYPIWKRWLTAILGAALITVYLIVRPNIPWLQGATIEDCWDGRSDSCQ